MADKTYIYKMTPPEIVLDINGDPIEYTFSHDVTVTVTFDESKKDQVDRRMNDHGWYFDSEVE